MPTPNQLPKLSFEGLDPVFQQWLNQLTDTVNTHSGYNGEIGLKNHINLNGNRLTGLGEAVEDNDALTSGSAAQSYSASALRPKLESNGSDPMLSMRRLNDATQRESTSSYLNDLISTPPNSNTINPIVGAIGGGVSSVTIPASLLKMGDGTSRYLPSRTDSLTNPVSIGIVSFTIAAGVATVVLASAPTPAFTDTTVVYIAGTGEIDGTFTVASIVNPTTFTIKVASGVSGVGGTVSSGGTYYYYISKRFNKVLLASLPSEADTPFNRLGISGDTLQLLAVIRINSDGSVDSETAGGGTPTGTTTANAGSRF